MDAWYEFGVHLSLLFQSASWLEAPMRFFTFLGTQEFFILMLPALYWCLDAGLGIRVGFILLVGNSLNEFIKMGLQGPRPYWVSSEPEAMVAESTFGVPSGHAQIAAGVWGMIAARLHRVWIWIAACAVILLIGLSRIYLAVHFPHDVLLGWILGGLTLWVFLAMWDRVARWIRGLRLLQQLLLSLVLPTVILLVGWVQLNALSAYDLPDVWMLNAARAGEPLPAPVYADGIVTAAGTLLGLSLGLALIQRFGGFKPSGTVWTRLACFVVGLVGVLILYLGLKAVLPDDDSLLSLSLRLVRYAALGLWVAAGAPVLFRWLHLIQPAQRTKPADAA